MKQSLQFSHIFRRGLALLLAILLLAALMLPSVAFAEGDVPAGDAGGEPAAGDSADPVVPPESGEAAEEEAGQIAAISPVGNGPSSGGSIASADGQAPSADDGEELPSEVEFFLASDGSDANDGSPEAPFATLSHAAEVASGTDAGCVILILLTDLVSEDTASFSGGNFILTSDDAICTISRGDDLRDHDSEAPLITVGDAGQYAEDGTTAELVLEYVVLDDSEGSASSGATVEVSDGAKLVVGDDASIYGRDGKAAVHGDPEAEIHVVTNGEIIGDTPFQAEEGCTVNVDDGAAVPGNEPSEDEPEDEPVNEPENESENEPEDEPEHSKEAPFSDASGAPVVTGDTDIPTLPADEAAPGDDNSVGDTPEDPDNPSLPADEAAPGDDNSVGDTAENPEANTVEEGELAENTGSLLGASRILSADSPVLAAASPMLAAGNDPDGFSLSAPVSISIDDTTVQRQTDIPSGEIEGYLIPYTISYKLSGAFSSSFLGDLLPYGSLYVQNLKIRLELSLPENVHPEFEGMSNVRTSLHPNDVFQVTEASFSGSTVSLELEETAQIGSDVLNEPLQLSIDTIFPKNSFTPDQIGKILTATATITEVSYTTPRDDNPDPLTNLGSSSAETKLLGEKTAKLIYDPNGGEGGPGEVVLSPEDNYVLNTSEVPSHQDIDGSPVLFIGWSEKQDEHIYANLDDEPATIKTINVTEGDNTVYAVYGYDRNADGIPDVNQRRFITLHYDPTDGSGTPEDQIKILLGREETFKIAETEPTREFYHFVGWRTENAEYAEYRYNKVGDLADEIRIGEDTTLYAVWEENPVYTLTFNGNGSSVSNIPSPVSAPSVEQGGEYVATIRIPTDEPTRSKYAFVGWAETADATDATYDPGETISITEDTTLYAVWVRYYTLYFNGTGASDIPDPISAPAVDGVASMTIPDKIPTRSRYDFIGWSPTRYGSATFIPGEDVKLTGGDVTLYAVWKRNAGTGSFSTTTNGKAPRTGDESNPALYALIAAGSAAALGAGIYILKKKRS